MPQVILQRNVSASTVQHPRASLTDKPSRSATTFEDVERLVEGLAQRVKAHVSPLQTRTLSAARKQS